jgi:hypothetical protein
MDVTTITMTPINDLLIEVEGKLLQISVTLIQEFPASEDLQSPMIHFNRFLGIDIKSAKFDQELYQD